MLFNSLEFAVFLPAVLLGYYLSGRRWRNAFLLAAGYLFYGYWDIRFLYLVSLSTVLDYCTGLMIGKGYMTPAQRRHAALHLVGFATCFLVPNWRAVDLSAGLWHAEVDWAALTDPLPFGVRVLAITVGVLALAALAYPRLAALPEPTRRLFFLRCSLIGQLGMLGVFKYYNFFVASAEEVVSAFGWHAASLRLDLVLPIGISFYTFQTLSYVFDVYAKRLEPAEHLLDFALFVSYFPPLVAGPIERASHLLPRILGERKVTFGDVTEGLLLIAVGLTKKVAIADGLAPAVSSVFDSTGAVGWTDIVAASVTFALQIYCDFSGYSDIACGCSLFFGIRLLANFNTPYFSVSPSEFWTRWHISLSSWLRDYLYIPLGGNRGTRLATHRNLMLTMVIGGLWHGAAWNFVLWGLYQGILLVGHRLILGSRSPGAAAPSLLARLPKMVGFFALTCYGWLLFRATSFHQIVVFTNTLVSDFSDLELHMKLPTLSGLLGVPLLLLLDIGLFKNQGARYLAQLSPMIRGAAVASLVVLIILGCSNESQQFIYFQF